MPQTLSRGKQLIRICPRDAKKIEYSTDGGRSWATRFSGYSWIGEFRELIDNGNEIIAQTTKGICYSTDEGRSWNMRHREGGSSGDNGLEGGCCGLVFLAIVFIVGAAISGDLPKIAAGVFEIIKELLAGALESIKAKLPG